MLIACSFFFAKHLVKHILLLALSAIIDRLLPELVSFQNELSSSPATEIAHLITGVNFAVYFKIIIIRSHPCISAEAELCRQFKRITTGLLRERENSACPFFPPDLHEGRTVSFCIFQPHERLLIKYLFFYRCYLDFPP